MSVQAVRDFWRKAKTDAALQKQLQGMKTDDKAAAAAAVVKVAAAAGFAFTAEEYQVAIRDDLSRQHAAGELSEQQLAEMAGGALGKSVMVSAATCYTDHPVCTPA